MQYVVENSFVEFFALWETSDINLTEFSSDGAATDRLDVASIEETASTAQAEAASSIPKPATSPEDKSKVTFDELGGKNVC